MNKKCSGCGAILQYKNTNEEGYINEKNYQNAKICERCFRIKNYGEYKKIEKDNISFIPILEDINKTNDLVVLLVDLFAINKNISEITKYLNNDILLVFTKRDILPLSVKDEKFLEYNNILNIKCVDSLVISSNKNYEFDLLYEKINKYKKSKNVYIVGYTNAGKSTMINKLIYNYSNLDSLVTTSILPSTTLNKIEIILNDDLTLIDTPGIIDNGNIINIIDGSDLKNILPNKEIKPITYQIKKEEYIIIDKYAKIVTENNNLTLFFSNKLNIERYYKDKNTNLKENIIRVKENEDIVISGLGFIKVTNPGVVKVYTLDGVDCYTRKSLI